MTISGQETGGGVREYSAFAESIEIVRRDIQKKQSKALDIAQEVKDLRAVVKELDGIVKDSFVREDVRERMLKKKSEIDEQIGLLRAELQELNMVMEAGQKVINNLLESEASADQYLRNIPSERLPQA